MISKRVIFLLIIYLLAQQIYTFEKKDFVISFSPAIMKGLDINNLHLANSLPRLLFLNLNNALNHKLSDEEILSIQENELNILKTKYLLELSSLKEKYDFYIFNANFNENEYLILKDAINNKLLQIKNLDSTLIIPTESYLSIKFMENFENTINGDIVNSENCDLIIKSSIEELDEWIYLEIWVENKILDTEDLIYKSVGSKENLSALLPEISSKLKTIILGRPWASLNLQVDQSGANILLKNNKGSIIRDNMDFLYPGLYNVEISKQGYLTKNISVELDDFEQLNIEYKMIIEEKGMISVQSFPAGADFYSGATWLGKTPLLIKSPVVPSLLTLKLKGYNNSKYIYSKLSSKNIDIFMESSLIDRNSIINVKRNNFYESFSYFLLSIPLSIISFGMSSDYGYAYNNEILDDPYSSESNRLMQLSTTWYNVYLGSLFVNISLFINTIFDLVDYIKSTNNL